VSAANARPDPARPGNTRALFPRQVLAVAIETFLQNRGPALWIVCAFGGAAALGAGAWLPRPAGDGGGLSALLLHGVLSLLLAAAALAAGARGLAGDRTTGLRDLFGSLPLSAPAFLLGRFGGLGARFAAAVLVLALLGGAALALLPDTGTFQMASEASRFFVGAEERDPGTAVLLPPDGTRARWIFDAGGPAAALRFTFRVRHPRGMPLQDTLPVRVEVQSGGRQVLAEDLSLSLRKEFTLPLPGRPDEETEVSLAIRGGHNFLETGESGCRILRGAAGPVAALLAAAVSFLPVLLTILALALLFSSFVSEPSALLAAAVLVLATLAAPSIEKDLFLFATGADPRGGAAHDHGHSGGGGGGDSAVPEERSRLLKAAASLAGRALAVLPDPAAGGGARPLSRKECPSRADVLLPWKEALPRIAVILLLGCLIASWRRP